MLVDWFMNSFSEQVVHERLSSDMLVNWFVNSFSEQIVHEQVVKWHAHNVIHEVHEVGSWISTVRKFEFVNSEIAEIH